MLDLPVEFVMILVLVVEFIETVGLFDILALILNLLVPIDVLEEIEVGSFFVVVILNVGVFP